MRVFIHVSHRNVIAVLQSVYCSIKLPFLCLLFIMGSARAQDTQLNKLVQAALKKNYGIANTTIELEKIDDDLQSLKRAYIPTVEAGAKYAYSWATLKLDAPAIDLPTLNIPAIPGLPIIPPIKLPTIFDGSADFPIRGNIIMADVEAKALLFSGMKIPYLKKAAKHKREAVELTIQPEHEKVVLEVTDLYDKIALLNQSKITLDEAAKRINKEQEFVKKAIENGLLTPVNSKKIDIALIDLKVRLEDYNGQRELLFAKLEQLTDISVDELSMLSPDLQVQMVQDEPLSAAQNRPELKAMEKAAMALQYKIKAEKTHWIPKVQALASVQYLGSLNSHVEAFNQDFKVNTIALSPLVMLGVGVKWELFDVNANRGAKLASLELRQLENRRKETSELLDLNARNCKIAYHSALTQVEMREKQSELARITLDIVTKEFRAGLATINQQLEAETANQVSRLAYLDSVYKQRRSALNLRKATGLLIIE